MLSYSAHPGGGRAILTPPAEIDLTNAGQLDDELNEALDRGVATLIVDMSTTEFCDCAGVAAFVRAHQRASRMNAELRLVILSKSYVHRIFEVSATDRLIQIYASLDAAQSRHR